MIVRSHPQLYAIILTGLLTLAGHDFARAALTQTDLLDARADAVLVLQCGQPHSTKIRSSLGALLQTAADGPDLALVAAHGLGEDPHHCSVWIRQAGVRQQLQISAVRRGAGTGSQADWAVLTLSGRFDPAQPRIAWHAMDSRSLDGLVASGVHLIKFPNGETGAGCTIRPPVAGYADERDKGLIVTGDCRTIPGMSGAPVIVKVHNAPTLVGLNIGHRYNLTPKNNNDSPRLSVIRLLDQQITHAIRQALLARHDSG